MRISLGNCVTFVMCVVCGFCIGKVIEQDSPERHAEIQSQKEIKCIREDLNQVIVILSELDNEQN